MYGVFKRPCQMQCVRNQLKRKIHAYQTSPHISHLTLEVYLENKGYLITIVSSWKNYSWLWLWYDKKTIKCIYNVPITSPYKFWIELILLINFPWRGYWNCGKWKVTSTFILQAQNYACNWISFKFQILKLNRRFKKRVHALLTLTFNSCVVKPFCLLEWVEIWTRLNSKQDIFSREMKTSLSWTWNRLISNSIVGAVIQPQKKFLLFKLNSKP